MAGGDGEGGRCTGGFTAPGISKTPVWWEGCRHRLGMLGPLACSEMPGNLEALAKFSLFAFSLAVTLGLVASALLQLVQISGRPIGISFPHTSK